MTFISIVHLIIIICSSAYSSRKETKNCSDADEHRRSSGRSRESRILASNRASLGSSAAVRPTEAESVGKGKIERTMRASDQARGSVGEGWRGDGRGGWLKRGAARSL